MALGRIAVNLFKRSIERNDRKRMKHFHMPDYEIKADIPYLDDGLDAHKFDVIYAKDNRQNVCIIDIHGGCYIFGNRKNNYYFSPAFLKAGYDFVSIDYKVNDGKRDFDMLLSDCADAINYIASHKKELGLENDKFVLTGDSAGGHLVLMLTYIHDSGYVRNTLGLRLNLKFECSLVNCPVYRFAALAKSPLSKSGMIRMLGPQFTASEEYRLKYSPASYIDHLKSPLFVSTCLNDFLKDHSHALERDLKKLQYKHFEFIDIQSNDSRVGHVHNVIDTSLHESSLVNQAMIEFIKKHTK